MAISGKVYIVPNAAENAWDLYVHNTGDQQIGVTQNILKKGSENAKLHDDHVQFGHGLLTSPGKVSTQRFTKGATYNHQGNRQTHVIDESCSIRVGLRGCAHQTVQLPPLNSGPVELDFQDFVWYGGASPAAANPQTSGMANYANQVKGAGRPQSDVADGANMLARIQSLIALSESGVVCKGKATVTAHPGPGGVLSHWTVRYDNEHEQAWIGTISFVGANKNDGIGLESMGVPHEGSAAVQRIEALGNYGTVAKPGAQIRLGVRGYSFKEIALPQGGSLELPLTDFELNTSKSSDEYFDTKAVEEKRNEKLERVQFFEGDKAINDELEPILYTGADARARSTFDAPELSVTKVAHSADTPGGGWIVEMGSTMPAQDDKGDLGFVATLRLGDTGFDGAALPPKKFEDSKATNSWFIPNGIALNGVEAKTGEDLVVGTSGMGWIATVRLPGRTGIDAAKEDVWGFREDKYFRKQLDREFTSRCRN